MNQAHDRPPHENLGPIEGLLERFYPVGPPVALREKVLAMADAAETKTPAPQIAGSQPLPARRPARRVALYLWRSAVAAGIVAMILLNNAADRISARTVARVGVGPAVWTEDCEQTAQLLDGEGWGRRYIALALMAGPFRSEAPPAAGGV